MSEEEEVRVTVCGAVEKRTIRIPDFVPDDHVFVYFTAASRKGLIKAVAKWLCPDPAARWAAAEAYVADRFGLEPPRTQP